MSEAPRGSIKMTGRLGYYDRPSWCASRL